MRRRKEKFRLMTLLGIRPDLIRMGSLIELLDRGSAQGGYEHLFVHSGQHFDFELDGVFYRELGLRRPDLTLGIGKELRRKQGSTDYVAQVALLFDRVQKMLRAVRPHAVLFLGDTNTCVASILVAREGIPVIHVEGGGRSYDWRMPEEKNRTVIDHLSDRIYCYLPRYRAILEREGIPRYRVKVVGNIIVDAIGRFRERAERSDVLERQSLRAREYCLVTLHREENTSGETALRSKVSELLRIASRMPVVFPVMPRVRAGFERHNLLGRMEKAGIRLIPPVGFLDFLKLEMSARVIVSDSGTVQEEALLLGVPCVVARRSTERPETLGAGVSLLREQNLDRAVAEALDRPRRFNPRVLNPQGGSPSSRVFRDLATKIAAGWFERSRSFRMIGRDRLVRQAYGRS